ncbi:MAG: hypothetical protein OEW23_12035, partial [Candidatus Aminicenantes bacterium]|nr:hypothetical protein [Candidatus Aminicenantes bacterium]
MNHLSYSRKPGIGLWALIVLFLFIFLEAFHGYAQEVTPEMYSALQYRHIGPPGNRTAAVVGVPGDPLVYYIGASSG